MSLHVRLQTSFWTHRKTLRLKVRIGDAALWVPPRLWSYAAENQPDGNFQNYSAEELAMLIGYLGNAQAMLVALQDCGWLDGMAIHDWQEHNGYHHTFAVRAKKAADARWKGKDKTGEDKKGKDKKGKEGSIASSNASSIPTEKKPLARPAAETDEQWIEGLKAMDCYQPLNVDSELGKARAWCSTRPGKQCTRRFFVNWLNRSLENVRTVAPSKTNQEPGELQKKYGW